MDVHRRNVEFQEGDQVMIRLRPECFPKGGYQKLHSRKAGPYKVLKRLGNNAYLLELPKELNISPIFNVEDPNKHYGTDEDKNPRQPTHRLPKVQHAREDIEDILD